MNSLHTFKTYLTGTAAALTLLATSSSAFALDDMNVKERMVHRHAVEAAVWSMPLISTQAMRDGLKEGAGVGFNDVAYNSKIQTWRLKFTTNNDTTPYVYIFWNVKEGPVVVDIPASAKDVGIFGTFMDAWQRPLEDVGAKGKDKGRGGKYLILPPGFQGTIPPGYIVLKQKTYNGYTAMRPIIEKADEANLKKAESFVKQIKVYPLAEAANPPETRYVDIYDKDIDGLANFDASFYQDLSDIIQEENIERKDLAMMGILKGMGIQKGQSLKMDARRKEIFDDAAEEVQEYFIDNYVDGALPDFEGNWSIAVPKSGIRTVFDWEFPGYLEIEDRGTGYYAFYTSAKNFSDASFYLMSGKDKKGQTLNGSQNYKLTVPKDVPVKDFWSVIAYNAEDATWFENQPKAGVASIDPGVEVNKDGSVDIYFGPQAPQGKEANWVPTTADKQYWLYFRFYGPQAPLFTKSWKLSDLENVD